MTRMTLVPRLVCEIHARWVDAPAPRVLVMGDLIKIHPADPDWPMPDYGSWVLVEYGDVGPWGWGDTGSRNGNGNLETVTTGHAPS